MPYSVDLCHMQYNFEMDDELRRVLEEIEAKGLTQTDLAAAIGTSQWVISRAESRKGNPSLMTLLKIAEALDVRLTLTPYAKDH